MRFRTSVHLRAAIHYHREYRQYAIHNAAEQDAVRWVIATKVYPAIRAETVRLSNSIVNGAYLSGRRLSKSREASFSDAAREARSRDFHHELYLRVFKT